MSLHFICVLIFQFSAGRGIMRGEWGTIPRAPTHCSAGAAEKSQQCRKYFLQYSICFRKILGSNMGAPNLFLAPGAI